MKEKSKSYKRHMIPTAFIMEVIEKYMMASSNI